jgi:hypothetical protein
MARISCDSAGVPSSASPVVCYTAAMFGFRTERIKASRAALIFAITTAVGFEGNFARLLWSDAKARGFKSAVGDHLFAAALGLALWGALPFIFFLISRELKKQGK